MQIKTVLTVLATAATFAVHAVPTTAEQAARAVGNWLVDNAALGCDLGASVAGARTLETSGGARFHVVCLQDRGFVIVSGDTSVEPIVAFSASGDLDETEDNPLYRLLDLDLSRRPLRAFKFASAPGASASVLSPEEAKWTTLLGTAATDDSAPRRKLKAAAGKASLSDCRVAPLLTTEWSQGGPQNVVGETALCYNYYTPNHYPCGCVATACAQIMYYHRQPTADYDWSAMVEMPAKGISDAGARAIGRLTADIGKFCGAEYYPGGTSMGSYMVAPLLMRVYGYGSAIAFQSETGYSASESMAAIIPNLDAKLPVALGLSDRLGYGHAVVADGYGYDFNTLYLHVNLGWAGMNDAWYAPPAIEDYSIIDGIVCNIDPKGSTKETLVSGRVLDETGAPVAGVKVSAGAVACETDAQGIYALPLPAGKQTIVAAFGSHTASTAVSVRANVGTDVDFATGCYYPNRTTIANLHGVDLTLSAGGEEPVDPPTPVPPPSPEDLSVAVSCELEGSELIVGSSVFCPVEITCTACTVKSVKASGLPSGLKLVSGKKASPHDYAIAGSVKKATKKPAVVKITVQVKADDAKVKKVPAEVKSFAMSVIPIDDWVVGTFSGVVALGEKVGALTMTVKSTGAVTGKVTVGGKAHSFNATGFSSVSEDGCRVSAELPKLKEILDFNLQPMTFGDDTIGHAADGGVTVTKEIWKLPAYKKLLKKYTSADKTLSWTTAGKVTWQTLVGGKKKKLTAMLLPVSSEDGDIALCAYFVEGQAVTRLDVTFPAADSSAPTVVFTALEDHQPAFASSSALVNLDKTFSSMSGSLSYRNGAKSASAFASNQPSASTISCRTSGQPEDLASAIILRTPSRPSASWADWILST